MSNFPGDYIAGTDSNDYTDDLERKMLIHRYMHSPVPCFGSHRLRMSAVAKSVTGQGVEGVACVSLRVSSARGCACTCCSRWTGRPVM